MARQEVINREGRSSIALTRTSLRTRRDDSSACLLVGRTADVLIILHPALFLKSLPFPSINTLMNESLRAALSLHLSVRPVRCHIVFQQMCVTSPPHSLRLWALHLSQLGTAEMSSCTKHSLTILRLGSPAFMEKVTHRCANPSAGEAKVGGSPRLTGQPVCLKE